MQDKQFDSQGFCPLMSQMNAHDVPAVKSYQRHRVLLIINQVGQTNLARCSSTRMSAPFAQKKRVLARRDKNPPVWLSERKRRSLSIASARRPTAVQSVSNTGSLRL
jgi:hypothetical protein